MNKQTTVSKMDNLYHSYINIQSKKSKINITVPDSIELNTDIEIDTINVESDMDMKYSDEYIYKKPWNKLNNIHKIIKVKEFVNNLLKYIIMETMLGVLSISAGTVVITQISSLSNNVFTLINNIIGIAKLSKNVYQIELIKVLTKTDIEATLKLLHAIILEIPLYINLEQTNNSVVIALDNVKDIIGKIEEELNLIHTKIEYNNSLYVLSHIRSIDCICNLENIEILIIVLDRRCNYLFTTLDIFKKYKTNGISSYL